MSFSTSFLLNITPSNNTQTPTFASKYKSIIMSTFQNTAGRMTNYRWIICAMLFFATTVNYLDRQVLSLTWKDFISPEFHWTDTHYGYITAIFSIVYALGNLFAGRFIDWMGTKKGYLMGHCRMVYRCLYARPLRTCHRNDPRH